MTALHRQAHLRWCRQHVHWNLNMWRNVMFSNESRFCLRQLDHGVKVWRRRGERYADCCTESNIFWWRHCYNKEIIYQTQICIYICVCVCTYIHTYIYIHIYTRGALVLSTRVEKVCPPVWGQFLMKSSIHLQSIVLSLTISFMDDIVLNAELKSTNSVLM